MGIANEGCWHDQRQEAFPVRPRPVDHKCVPPFGPACTLRHDAHDLLGFGFAGERAHDAVEHEKGLLWVGVGG